MATKVKQVEMEEVTSWEEADQSLKEIAVLTAEIEQKTAAYNAEEQKQRMKELTTPLEKKYAKIKALEAGLLQFSLMNRADFGKLKSKELKHGTVMFRLGTHKVLQIKKFTVDVIIELIKKTNWKSDFLRTKVEINKESIIAAYRADKNPITDEELKGIGLQIVQDEEFKYDLKNAVDTQL